MLNAIVILDSSVLPKDSSSKVLTVDLKYMEQACQGFTNHLKDQILRRSETLSDLVKGYVPEMIALHNGVFAELDLATMLFRTSSVHMFQSICKKEMILVLGL